MVYLYSLIGASCYAIASVLQQLEARRAPSGSAMKIGLLTHLIRQRIWLTGIIFDCGGYGMQALALSVGPLSLVEPLFVCGLLFALPLGAMLMHRRPTPVEWVGGAAVTAGLAAFVRATEPQEGRYDIALHEWVFFALAVAAVTLVSWLIGRTGRGPWQAVSIGLSAGVAFAFATALTKYATEVWENHGLVALLGTGAPYALVVIGAVALLLSQSAFQSGSLQASLPMLTVSEPVVSSGTGLLLFHEHIKDGSTAIVVAVISAVMISLGVVGLARAPESDQVVSA